MVDASSLSDAEFLVLEALEHRKALKVQDVMDILDRKTVLPMLKTMLAAELITLQEEVYNTYKPKTDKFISFNVIYQEEEALKALLDSLTRAPKQREVV
ncbi:MAG: primosomal protein N', partial [Nonlabens sp.]|nr:primosomal protein N' [Nonlabens sp.]